MPPGKARKVWSEAKLTIRPQPLAFIAGTSCCDRKNGADRLSARVVSQPSGVTSSARWRVLMPAAWTTISGAPKGAATARTRSGRLSRSATSCATQAAWGPVSACHSARASARRATPTTCAPARASRLAAWRPSPELAPVTQATLPVRSNSAERSAICGEIEVLAGEVLAQPDIGGAGVPFHAFEPRDARGGFGHGFAAFAGGALPCDDLHVLVHAEPTGIARHTRGG